MLERLKIKRYVESLGLILWKVDIGIFSAEFFFIAKLQLSFKAIV